MARTRDGLGLHATCRCLGSRLIGRDEHRRATTTKRFQNFVAVESFLDRGGRHGVS